MVRIYNQVPSITLCTSQVLHHSSELHRFIIYIYKPNNCSLFSFLLLFSFFFFYINTIILPPVIFFILVLNTITLHFFLLSSSLYKYFIPYYTAFHPNLFIFFILYDNLKQDWFNGQS